MLPLSACGALSDCNRCFNRSPFQNTLRMTICDNPLTKPCSDTMCDRDRQTREIVESLNRVVWFIAFRPRSVVYVNPAFTTLWGIDREELYRNPQLWMARVHADDCARVERTFDSWISSAAHHSYEIEYRVIVRDGSIHWVRDVVSPLLDDKGALCGSTGTLEDITKEKNGG